jgi:hypothetical protein
LQEKLGKKKSFSRKGAKAAKRFLQDYRIRHDLHVNHDNHVNPVLIYGPFVDSLLEGFT